MFMGGGGGRGRREREKKSEDVVHKLSASLVELYSGATKKLSLSRNLQCSGCKGAGTKSGKKYECTTCKGTGVQVMIRPLGPGMVQQIQQRCSNCSGSGSMVPPSDVCGTCKGKGLVAEKKTFEVTIEPGMKQLRGVEMFVACGLGFCRRCRELACVVVGRGWAAGRRGKACSGYGKDGLGMSWDSI
eukprot:1148822-Pelagomonas_calceolata.AAC.2